MPAMEHKSEEKQLGFQMRPDASRVGQAKNATPRPKKKEVNKDLPGILFKRCHYVLLMMELLYSSSANQHFQISQSRVDAGFCKGWIQAWEIYIV